MNRTVIMRMRAASLILAALCVGCANPAIKQVDSETFVRYGNEIHETHGARWTAYIGASNARAYIEHTRPSLMPGRKWASTVYWTPLGVYLVSRCSVEKTRDRDHS